MSPETWTAWAFGFFGGMALVNGIWMIVFERLKKK